MGISKAGRVVTLEEQKEELESLRREVDQLKKSLSKGGGAEVDVEKELAKVNREYDEVVKEMDSMRINFREKSNLVGDCENLRMMIGYVKEDSESEESAAEAQVVDIVNEIEEEEKVKGKQEESQPMEENEPTQ